MFEKKDTAFRSGRILTQEMLDLLYAWPRQTVQLSCRHLADGILCGMEYEVSGDDFLIHPGILWHQGEPWFLRQTLSLKSLCREKQPQDGQHYFLQLLPETRKAQGNVTTRLMDMTLAASDKGMTNFGSFYYQSGMIPRLPSAWQEMIENLDNTFYFNLSSIPWAAPEEATFHPLIFTYLAQALEQKSSRSALETAMLVQLYERGTLTMKTLRLYTGDSDDVSREALLKHMDQALQKVEAVPTVPKMPPQEPKKVKRMSIERGMI